ncbi:secreted RxLR effector protein 161-like [Phragmites australis]|uniref:secreted RxLR effector protein 161-like n=1 Tax=Phragmites australis TaxID=29695 RepID=UPI002D79AF9C|nr:secreted RxLR effector protein 161-like [Phragmites australis]
MYVHGVDAHRLVVGVYVNDLVITSGNLTELEQFKEEMKGTFQMSVLGLLHYYLSLEMSQTDNGITTNATPATDAAEYRRIVGSLRYLVNSRPDLAFSVGYISRFMEKPTTEHLVTAKRVLRYVAGTINYGCCYQRKTKAAQLIGYSDNDLVGDIDTLKSTTEVLFFVGRNLVTWQSHKQKVVVLSSCKAKYIAVTTATCHGVWLARLLAELRGEEACAITLKIDNQTAIMFSKNLVFHHRSKYIDTRYH